MGLCKSHQAQQGQVGKKFLIIRIAKHWNELPRKDALFLQTFKISLDLALSNLMQLQTFLFIAGELD